MGTAVKKTKGENTRELILETAISLLAKKGYEQMSFQEIADTCNLSQAAPLYHFKSKEGLFREAIEYIRKNRTKWVSYDIQVKDDAYQRLLKYFRGRIDWANVYRFEAVVFSLLSHFAAFNKDFAELYQSILKDERDEIESLIAAGLREKIFHTQQHTSLLAEILHDAILGMTINLLAGRGVLSTPRQWEKKIKYILQSVLGWS